MRLFCQPHGGCQPDLRFVPWACVLGLCADFLGTISYPPALSRSELGQGLNCFLDRAAIMMASLRNSRPSVLAGVSNALEVYHD